MRLKRYTVKDMQEARRVISADLGSDAVIVHTQMKKPSGLRRIWQRAYLEVLAAVEETPPSFTGSTGPASGAAGNDERLKAIEERLNAISESLQTLRTTEPQPAVSWPSGSLVERLRKQELAPSIVEAVAFENGTALDKGAIVRRLSDMLPPCRQLTIHGTQPEVVCFVGPTGVGKTTTLAKVAAELVLRHGRQVAIATADTLRVAAVPQIQIYAELLGVPLKVAYDPDELSAAVEALACYDAVLVDMPGRSTSDEDGLRELRLHLEAVPQARTFLLLEAGASLSKLRRVAHAFQASQCEGLIFTKLDETPVFGPMISVAVEIKKPVFYLTTGQNVPEDIEPATADRMLSMLLGSDYEFGDSASSEFVPMTIDELAREMTEGRA